MCSRWYSGMNMETACDRYDWRDKSHSSPRRRNKRRKFVCNFHIEKEQGLEIYRTRQSEWKQHISGFYKFFQSLQLYQGRKETQNTWLRWLGGRNTVGSFKYLWIRIHEHVCAQNVRAHDHPKSGVIPARLGYFRTKKVARSLSHLRSIKRGEDCPFDKSWQFDLQNYRP